jgi:hypothetical protein
MRKHKINDLLWSFLAFAAGVNISKTRNEFGVDSGLHTSGIWDLLRKSDYNFSFLLEHNWIYVYYKDSPAALTRQRTHINPSTLYE